MSSVELYLTKQQVAKESGADALRVAKLFAFIAVSSFAVNFFSLSNATNFLACGALAGGAIAALFYLYFQDKAGPVSKKYLWASIVLFTIALLSSLAICANGISHAAFSKSFLSQGDELSLQLLSLAAAGGAMITTALTPVDHEPKEEEDDPVPDIYVTEKNRK